MLRLCCCCSNEFAASAAAVLCCCCCCRCCSYEFAAVVVVSFIACTVPRYRFESFLFHGSVARRCRNIGSSFISYCTVTLAVQVVLFERVCCCCCCCCYRTTLLDSSCIDYTYGNPHHTCEIKRRIRSREAKQKEGGK